jgi:hypothetical protein
MWVRSKYTSELAVLAAWLTVLIPGTVVHQSDAPVGGSVIFLRFALFELQIRQPGVIEVNGQRIVASEPLAETYAGTSLVGDLFVATPPGSIAFYDGTLQQASVLWTVGAVSFALALLLSLALYFRTEQTVHRLPVSEVRLMGALLGITALGLAGGSVLSYTERAISGLPIPVGVLIIGLLSVVLLLTKEVPDETAAS